MTADTRNKRSPDQRLADRVEIARLYLQGFTQSEIAGRLGVVQQQVSYDIIKIREQWRASAIRDFDEAKARELGRIDLLEIEYWDAWQRSKQDRTTQSKKVKSVAARPPDELGEEETTLGMTAVGRDGNPAFLAGVQWCISQRVKILGLEAPVTTNHNIAAVTVSANAPTIIPQEAVEHAHNLLRVIAVPALTAGDLQGAREG